MSNNEVDHIPFMYGTLQEGFFKKIIQNNVEFSSVILPLIMEDCTSPI